MIEVMQEALKSASNEDLLKFSHDLITMCDMVFQEAKSRDILNSQSIIDWLDSLNEISVRN